MELLRGLDVITWGGGQTLRHEAVATTQGGQAGNAECSGWEVEGAGKSAKPLEWGEVMPIFSGAPCQILAHPPSLISKGPPPGVLPEPRVEPAPSARLPCTF